MASFKVVAIALLVFASGRVLAQNSSVVCSAQWSWMSNSLSQNPCLVAAYLESVCLGPVNIPPYSNDTSVLGTYSAPQGSQANRCTCNTVAWALVSACLVCQDVTPPAGYPVSWNTWISAGCVSGPNTVYIGQYPEVIPNQTAIPHWSFYNYTVGNGLFNATIAKQLGDSPESTNTSSPNQTSSQINVAQIVACVIGGIAAIIGISTLLVLRHSHSRAKKRRNDASTIYVGHTVKPAESPVMVPPSRPTSWETLPPYDSWYSAPLPTPLHCAPVHVAQRRWLDGGHDHRYCNTPIWESSNP